MDAIKYIITFKSGLKNRFNTKLKTKYMLNIVDRTGSNYNVIIIKPKINT